MAKSSYNQCDLSQKTASENEQPGHLILGNKYFLLVTGPTLRSHEQFIDQLKEKVSWEKVNTVDECDFILVFCPIVSRAGTDTEAALKQLQKCSADRPALLVVLHHTFDPECVVPDSRRAVNRKNTIAVDCLFHEDQGLLQCKKNSDAIRCIVTHAKPKIQRPSLFPGGSNKKSYTQPPPTFGCTNSRPLEFEAAAENICGVNKELENIKKEIDEKEGEVPMNEEIIITTELRLVLLGSHNSAVKDIILGREESNHAETSTTTANQCCVSTLVAGRKVTVMDIPDWSSSGTTLEELSQTVGPQAFLLIIPVKSEGSVYSEDYILKMEEIFGERCWRNTMIIFIATDELPKSIEEFIQSGGQEVQKLLEKCENRFHCFNVKESGDGSQVSELLEKIEKMVEGNRNGTETYQIITDIDKERHNNCVRIKEMKGKMTKFLKTCQEFIEGFENDLKCLKMEERKEDNIRLIKGLKKEYGLKRDIGVKIKEIYDKVTRLEDNRLFIKVTLPENQQTIWLSLPAEQIRNPKMHNEVDRLEELFLKIVGRMKV